MFQSSFKKTKQKIQSTVLASVFVTLFCPMLAVADEIPTDWKSIRSVGMGDSFTAVANDETAAFTNPAGLAKTRNPRSRTTLHLLSFPGMGIVANTAGMKALNSGTKGFNLKERLGDFVEASAKNPAAPLYLETQLFPAAIIGNRKTATYILGIPFRSVTKLSVPDAATPNIARLSAVNTATALLGVASSSTRGGLNYGLMVRPNYRYTYISDAYDTTGVSADQLKSKAIGDATKTSAVALDAGFMYTEADFWMPTVGVAIRNIPTGCVKNFKNPVTGKLETVCGTLRTGGAKSEHNEDRLDPTEVRAGLSITPRLKVGTTRVNLRISADVYPIPIKSGSNNYGVPNLYLNKILHAGAELSFGNSKLDDGFSLRGGMSQGMPSYGASIDFIGIALDYASYFEDIGEGTTRRADRRHLLGVSTHW